MIIRKTTYSDLDEVIKIYAKTKEYMDLTGNPTQWKRGYPGRDMIEADIGNGCSYVCESENGLHGVFVFIVGEDSTYKTIYDGAWKSNELYGTIHRIASNGTVRGVFKAALEYCKAKIGNIRIDTHENNKVMQRLVEANGFERAGIIYVADGTSRIAYESLT